MKRVNGPRWARQAQRGDPTVSLMRMRWHALEPIDRAGLGGAQGQPILGGILEADEELFARSPRVRHTATLALAVTPLPKSNMPMSLSTSSTAVRFTRATDSFCGSLTTCSAGSTRTRVAAELWTGSCTALSGNSTLCENSSR